MIYIIKLITNLDRLINNNVYIFNAYIISVINYHSDFSGCLRIIKYKLYTNIIYRTPLNHINMQVPMQLRFKSSYSRVLGIMGSKYVS